MEVTNQDIDKLSKKEDIKKEIDKVKPQAEQLSKDPDKLEKFLIEAEEYCQKIPGVGDDLATIPTLIRLVRDYCNKSYTDIPTGTIIAIIAALIYVVSPVDIIPDELIPVIGFVDDAAVVKFCIEMIKNDLNKYKQWKENNKMSIKDLNEELEKFLEVKPLRATLKESNIETLNKVHNIRKTNARNAEVALRNADDELTAKKMAVYQRNYFDPKKSEKEIDELNKKYDDEINKLAQEKTVADTKLVNNNKLMASRKAREIATEQNKGVGLPLRKDESLMHKRNKQLRKVSESAGDKYLKISYDGKEIDVYTITRYMGNIIPEDFDITKFKIEILDSQNL